MVRRNLDDKGAVYNGSECDDSDTDDNNYNGNNEHSSSYLRVLPILAVK